MTTGLPTGALALTTAFPRDESNFTSSPNRVLDWIVVIRILVGVAMAIYILVGILTGFDIPLVRRISAYLYFGVAAAIPVIYWTRSVSHRRAASVAQFMGFTAFLLGNWSYTISFHLGTKGWVTRGWIWLFVWLLEIYVEGALLRGRSFNPLYPITALRQHLEDRRTLIQELNATKLQLARINRSMALSAMANSIAHEISQPLAAVVVNANAARRWLSSNNVEEAQKAIMRAAEDGHRANAVITSFRRLMQEDEPLRVSANIGGLIEQALDIHAADLQKYNVAVRVLSLKEIPSIAGDPVQLRQVFLNLVANAIDALSETPGEVRQLIVRCERVEHRQALISFEDNGPGIQDPEHIWDLFFTTKAKGMGMGLFISRMIVEAHGGTLTVKSQSGRTKFYVSLPVKGSQHRFNGVRSGKRPIIARRPAEPVVLGWAQGEKL